MNKIIKISFITTIIILMTISLSMIGCKTAQKTSASSVENTASVTKAEETTVAATTEAAKKLKFAFSVAILDNPYFIEVANGFKDKCAELGIEAIVTDAKYDAPTQFNQLEDFISSKVDAIAAAPVDQKSLQEVVQKAKDNGIIVVGEAQGIDNADGNVIVNDYEYGLVNGKNAAKWIKEKLGGKANVILLTLDHVEAVIKRGDGMIDAIKKECPDAKIIARQSAETMEKAMNITETLLQAHPEINVIVCVNDQHALGALQAVKNMNIKDPNFFIGGADNTAEARAAMVEPGSVFRVTIDIDPYGTGKKLVEVMYDYVQNGPKGETFYFTMTPVWQEDLLKEKK